MGVLRNVTLLPKLCRLFKNPFNYYLDKLSIWGKNHIVRIDLRNGLSFRIHGGNSDINSILEVFLCDLYSQIIASVPSSANVVDVGANIGIVSVALASRLRSGKVYAFEPNPYVVDLLRDNARLNGLQERIVVFPIAVAKKREKRQMYFKPLHWGGASLCEPISGAHEFERLQVDCVGLDDVFSLTGLQNIDLLKIDCEGGEGEILQGATSKYLARVSRMLIEYHEPHVSPDHLRKSLESQGFQTQLSNDFPAFLADRITRQS